MIELLIIADDFTGALDTGVQFSVYGISTRVLIANKHLSLQSYGDCQVLVVNAQTRGVPPEDAYDAVCQIVNQAITCGIPHIYKKTDSALRGNIGSELTAVLDASGGPRLHFIPAFPKMGRITEENIHYINGIPVNESEFGRDPFEPVKTAHVPAIIALQSKCTVLPETDFEGKRGIVLHNASSEQQLDVIARRLLDSGELTLSAGCAGFAAKLPQILGLSRKMQYLPQLADKVVIICGSLNPITVRQMDYAERNGIPRICLTPQQKLDSDYFDSEQGMAELEGWRQLVEQSSCCIFDTNSTGSTAQSNAYAERKGISQQEARASIPRSLSTILKYVLEQDAHTLAFITGGDTLAGFMEHIGCDEIQPVCELEPGTVFSLVGYKGSDLQIVSKSGGFGDEALVYNLIRSITQSAREEAHHG